MGGQLVWKGEALEQLRSEIRAAQAATSAPQFWGDDVGPGLVLVGDQGVYFMAHCDRGKMPEGGWPVAYAKGCHPKLDADFYDNKRAIWGGDDGAEFFPLDDVIGLLDPKIGEVVIKVSRTHFEILTRAFK